MTIFLPRGEVFENVNQTFDIYFQSHLFMHFPLQSLKDRFTKINLAARHNPQIQKRGDAPPGQEHPPIVVHDHRHNRGDNVFFFVALLRQALLLPAGLHQRPDAQPQAIDLDESLGISLVENLILLEGGEVKIEE